MSVARARKYGFISWKRFHVFDRFLKIFLKQRPDWLKSRSEQAQQRRGIENMSIAAPGTRCLGG
jgi:hypothetical protein